MINRRKQMEEYVVSRLEDSGIYVARKVAPDCLQLQTKGKDGAYVFLHASPNGAQDFIHRQDGLHRLIYSGNFVTNIFYKDGENFFVLLDDELKGKLRKKSMKNYPYDELSRMVSLRKKEREVLRLQRQKRLVYYQPENTTYGGRLHEGLVSFAFSPVIPSYSHLNPNEDKGYDFIMADDGKVLDTRMISGDKRILDGRLKLVFSRRSPHIFTLGSTRENDNYDLSGSTRNNNCDFNPEEYFLRQTGMTREDFGGDISEYINPQ